MNIDKLILDFLQHYADICFSSLMNIDKLILWLISSSGAECFSPLMNIDKLIHILEMNILKVVLVL